MIYLCVDIDSLNQCQQYVEFTPLSVDDGVMLGGMFLSLCVLAWCISYVLRFIINR